MQKIILKWTRLKKIREDTFAIWSNITRLEITENLILFELSKGAFNGLTALENLSINNNFNLSVLHEDIFNSLHNLRIIS
ncbi:hypothetical protein ACUWC3_28745, partial [Klebsiella pneumoniae]|uniref:hypothetical protein n=1 Tax=Klebsiella pneumoniae TaxID=573 RepID=UPI0040554D7E